LLSLIGWKGLASPEILLSRVKCVDHYT